MIESDKYHGPIQFLTHGVSFSTVHWKQLIVSYGSMRNPNLTSTPLQFLLFLSCSAVSKVDRPKVVAYFILPSQPSKYEQLSVHDCSRMRKYSSKVKLKIPLQNLVTVIENRFYPCWTHQVQNPSIVQNLSVPIHPSNHQADTFIDQNVHTVTAPRLRLGPMSSHCLPTFDYSLSLGAFFVFIKSKQKNLFIEPAVSELSTITNDSIQLKLFLQMCVNFKSI